jgi:hypothetical protein
MGELWNEMKERLAIPLRVMFLGATTMVVGMILGFLEFGVAKMQENPKSLAR